MSAIKNVAIAGAAGALGEPVLSALVKSGKFTITAIVRSAGKATFDPSVKVVEADFESVESLTKALQGQDAVVSTVGTSGMAGQTLIIDAAIAAGVQRFIPSEFGSDLSNPETKKFPVFGGKVTVLDHAEKKIRTNPSLSYTYIRNGAFLDWGLERGFLFNWESGKPQIFDSGDQEFSASSLASISQAVVGILTKPEETKNRAVYIHDMQITQNRIQAVVKKIAPEWKLEPEHVVSEEVLKSSNARIAQGDYSMPVMFNYLFLSLLGPGFGGRHTTSDNELLGITGDKTDADVEAILRPIIEAKIKSA